ncbi:MAG: ABC transporter transmembrane domain-containing protein, partial [Myxococcota bacterium]
MNRETLRRLATLARPEAQLLVFATVALAIASGTTLLVPLVVQQMVDALSGVDTSLPFDALAGALFGIAFVASVFAMIRSWLFTLASERVVARLRTDLYRAVMAQDVSFFDQTRTGELTSRLASDTTVLQNTVTVNVSMAIRYGFGALGGAAMLLYKSPALTALALSVVPVAAIGAAVYGRMVRRVSTDVQDALARSSEIAEESIGGLRTVRSFAREATEVDRYSASVTSGYDLAARRAWLIGLF